MQVLVQQSSVPEYITYLLDHPRNSRHLVLLQNTINRQISAQDRQILLYWTMDISNSLNIPMSTAILACHYIDYFLSKRPLTKNKIFEVVGITALSLAFKFKDGITISPYKIQELMQNRVSIDAILTTEQYFLKVLDWELFLVTTVDLIEAICEFTIGEGCQRVVNHACTLAGFGYCDLIIAAQGVFNTAIACIILSINKLGFSHMKNTWIDVVQRILQPDLQIVCETIKVLEDRLNKFSSG